MQKTLMLLFQWTVEIKRQTRGLQKVQEVQGGLSHQEDHELPATKQQNVSVGDACGLTVKSDARSCSGDVPWLRGCRSHRGRHSLPADKHRREEEGQLWSALQRPRISDDSSALLFVAAARLTLGPAGPVSPLAPSRPLKPCGQNQRPPWDQVVALTIFERPAETHSVSLDAGESWSSREPTSSLQMKQTKRLLKHLKIYKRLI